MSTPNFRTQENFDLFIYDDSDFFDHFETEILCEDIQAELDFVNSGLTFHEIKLHSGYYTGLQFYVNEHYTADDLETMNSDECRYYFDLTAGQAKAKHAAEVNRIQNTLTELADHYGFEQTKCVGIFSNGEAIYKRIAG